MRRRVSILSSILLALVEEINLFATGVIAMLILFVFITLRKIKRETKASAQRYCHIITLR
jgi:hypothetical protein